MIKDNVKRIILNKPIIITIFAFLITSATLLNYTADSLLGNIEWSIMSSTFFGVPEDLQDVTGEPLCTNGAVGWDGQFYYYISNDLLGTEGYSQHVDAPSYRWQRVGLPLVVKCVSVLLGQEYTTVGLYLFVNILIITAATYIFARFLQKRGMSVLWVLPWILSVGVQITLRHALPDGAADAFLLMAIICLLEKKYIGYSALISLAALSREAGILIAFLFFIMAFLGIIEREKRFNIKFAIPFAIPGIIFVAWYGYVTMHFGVPPFEQAHGITQFFLTGFIDYFVIALKGRNLYELLGNLIYAITIIGSLVICVVCGKKEKIHLSFVPYIVLLGCFGPTVMMHYSGYLKGISSLYAIIPIVLADYFCKNDINPDILKNRSISYKMIACFFAAVLFTGVAYTENHGQNLYINHYGVEGTKDNTTTALTEFSSEITLNENKGEVWTDIPYANIFMNGDHYTSLNVNVKNTSSQTWNYLFNEDNIGAVFVSYQWYSLDNPDELYMDGIRTTIGENIAPGESVNVDMLVKIPSEPGEYVLKLSMVQEGVTWFHLVDGGCLELNYVVT